ncbi:receptor-like protein 12 [Ananas comosus]|uniref:Receptor-like protein 12 n=1 Tax=Ananas comosus TaxID=4615 RepID=A0A6P5F0G3_ANACO|nr:receptor-like protein 12 [Ananas comosus]
MSSRHRPPNPLFLILTLLLFAFSSAGAVTALCLRDQFASLLQLKRRFSGGSLTSWVAGTDCCAWGGVECDPVSGRVTALDLSGRSIAGELYFPALFNLTSLRSLNLAYNLFDQIPLPQLGFEALANLTRLNLSNSGFVGQVPASISRLSNLVSLDLSTFYLNERPNSSLYLRDPTLRTLIANLGRLQFLYLDGVEIAADGPGWCGAVAASAPGLRELSLSGCSLAGPLNPSLLRLRWLSKLRLDQNNLSSPLPEFFFTNFSSLGVLRLSSCGLKGVFPDRILQLRNLTVLDVSANPLLSGWLPDFPKDSVLESLVLSSTNFSGNLPDSIGNLKSLTRLELSECGFSGSIPASVANLTQLVHLDLSFNNFSGRIPSFGQWPMISEINLAHNSLSGSIPPSDDYAGLRKLTKIDLRNNSLTGPIPGSLFAIPSLQLLQLSQNQLSGILAGISNASSSLATIDLSYNNLQGIIPQSVSQLSGLSVLSLASNNFSGTLALDILRSMRNLSKLDLSNNMIIVVDGDDNSSFDSFPKISTLKLASCYLLKIPTFLRYQDVISDLDLSNNKISGAIPSWIWSIGMESWTYLNLSHNMFTSVEGLTDLSSIPLMTLDIHSNMLQGSVPFPPPNIIILDYSYNNFSSSIPFSFPSYLNVTIFFSVSHNRLTGEIPASFCNATYLQVLDLSYNGFSGSMPSCLLKGNSGDLRILNLGANQLTGTLPQDVSGGCELRTINLSSNMLEGKLPQSLANCRMLEVLDIGNNQIVDSFPYWLRELSALQVLVLRSNGFYGPAAHPTSTTGRNSPFPMLQIFDISSNSFNGMLPSDCFSDLTAMKVGSEDKQFTVGFSYLNYTKSYYEDSVTVTFKGLDITLVKILTVFTSLDLSNNGFEGGIPESVGELKMLYLLNISHNSFSGEIPSQIGNLSQLESLDLSSNNLSGEIPQTLALLTFLSSLNLSYNNLVGGIPQYHQFPTFSNLSFLGNPGLCGQPLTRQCNSSRTARDQALNSKSIELNWQFISAGIGYGGGLAIVVGPLMVWSKGKRWFNKYVDRMLLAVLPLWLCETCGDGRVGTEEGDDDADSMEEEENRKFCVFCTGLEIHEDKVVIHHVECSCPKF